MPFHSEATPSSLATVAMVPNMPLMKGRGSGEGDQGRKRLEERTGLHTCTWGPGQGCLSGAGGGP